MTYHHFLFPVIFYIIGSVPFSFIVVKLMKGKDIREFGSGNVGGTNAFRAAGPFGGILSLLLDISKSAIPLIIVKYHFNEVVNNDFILLLGIFSLLGHSFPVFLKFKGGKGVAVGLGILIALFPVMLTIYCLAVFIVIFMITHIVSISSISAALALLTLTFFQEISIFYKFFLIAIALFVIIKHHVNIVRLVKKEEKKIF